MQIEPRRTEMSESKMSKRRKSIETILLVEWSGNGEKKIPEVKKLPRYFNLRRGQKS